MASCPCSCLASCHLCQRSPSLALLHAQAHFLQLSARDDALSRSLNSDYLAQLYISPDTKNMDEELFSTVDLDKELPPEARTVLVFKRGCVSLVQALLGCCCCCCSAAACTCLL